MTREGQVFHVGECILVCVRSKRKLDGDWWHDLMTLDDWSFEPWPGGHIEQYAESWIARWTSMGNNRRIA